MKDAVAPTQNRSAVFPQLDLIRGKRHVPAIAQNVNEFHLRKLCEEKPQQVNAPRRFPAPMRFGRTGRMMSIEGGMKFQFHSLQIDVRQTGAVPFGVDKRIDPSVMKGIKLKGVFRRIPISAEIVTSEARDPRDHARS